MFNSYEMGKSRFYMCDIGGGGTDPSVSGLLHLVMASFQHIVTNYRTSFLFLVYYTYTMLSLTIYSVTDTCALATVTLPQCTRECSRLLDTHVSSPLVVGRVPGSYGSSSFNLRETSELFSSMAING